MTLRQLVPTMMFATFFTVVVVSHVAAGTGSVPVEPALQKYLGTYRYVGGSADIEALDRSIDDVVSRMNFLIRGIARRRLREPNLPSKEVTISLDDGQIRIERPGQPPVSAPANGTAITWQHPEEGDVFRVQHGIDARGELYQRFEGERSVSRNRFVLSDDENALSIHTFIQADRLPAPLRFQMSYRRADSTP